MNSHLTQQTNRHELAWPEKRRGTRTAGEEDVFRQFSLVIRNDEHLSVLGKFLGRGKRPKEAYRNGSCNFRSCLQCNHLGCLSGSRLSVVEFYRNLGFEPDPEGIKGMFWYPKY
ncbi:hypothetical protein RHGRI_014672 [Rhododendron griersonianum]|nr:hypothetical protein RHGRI_014672 [Rhododendron griersonianum]